LVLRRASRSVLSEIVSFIARPHPALQGSGGELVPPNGSKLTGFEPHAKW